MTELKDDCDPPMYDAFAAGFLEHARDGACNAHYDRPAVLAALGPVAGMTVGSRSRRRRRLLRERYPELAEELANRPVFVVFALRRL